MNSLLDALTADEVRALFEAGSPRLCTADEVILTQDEPGDSMFFLLEGYAEARSSGTKPHGYAPGSSFGEFSFINPGAPRSATVIATTAARLQVLDQTSVQGLIDRHPAALVSLLRRSCTLVVDFERNLNADLRCRNVELQQTIKHFEFTRHRLSQDQLTARTDELTGLSNRHGFDAELPVFIERARSIDTGLALIVMRLDFKPINLLGQTASDAVMREVGQILRQGVRKTDLPCRTSGDEFVIVLADLNEAAAQMRAEVLRDAICALFHPELNGGPQQAIVMGGTMYRPSETPEDFVHRAHQALRAAKHSGRSRVGWAPV